MFKDLHCHILPGIDDGCKTIEESIIILKQAEKEGVTDIILTPHYIEDTKYNCDNKNKKALLDELRSKCQEENININLYLGNENYMTENFVKLLEERKITTLNNTRYMLFEFPLNQMYQNSKEILYELVTIGCVPVLAHPERYKDFQKHPELAEEYVRMGIILQGNYMSILGKYGKAAQKTLKIFLKKGLISVLGSDIHHPEEYQIEKARKKIRKIVRDDKVVEDLFCNNFDKIINDEDFDIKR